MRAITFLFCVVALWAPHAHTNTGADTLLDTLGVKQSKAPKDTQGGFVTAQLKNPFLIQFFSQAQMQRELPYDVRAWVGRILNEDYQQAAHLWTAIEKVVPEDF